MLPSADDSGGFRDFLRTRLDDLRAEIEERVLKLAEEQVLSLNVDVDLDRSSDEEQRKEHAECQVEVADGREPPQPLRPRRPQKVLRTQALHSAVPPELPLEEHLPVALSEESPRGRRRRLLQVNRNWEEDGESCSSRHSRRETQAPPSPVAAVCSTLSVMPNAAKKRQLQVLKTFSTADTVTIREQILGANVGTQGPSRAGVTFSEPALLSENSRASHRPSRHSLYTSGIPNGDQGALSGIVYTAAFGQSTRQLSTAAAVLFGDKFGEWFMAFITIANTITIGLGVDYSPDWIGWICIDAFFALAFLVHMLTVLRRLGCRHYFLGRRSRCQLLSDADLRWRLFEFLLVVLAWSEVGLNLLDSSLTGTTMPKISIFRLLRLTRIARIVRLARLRMLNELTMMINGAIGGMRTLLWSIIIIALPLYAVAFLMHETLASESAHGSGKELFGSLAMSCFTLFRCVVGGDCSTKDGEPVFLLITEHFGHGYALVYCLTMMFMVFGLFNVIAAIFVENTLAGAKYNHIHQKRARLLDAQMFAEKTMELVRLIADRHDRNGLGENRHSLEDSQSEASSGSVTMIGDINMEKAMAIQITPEFFRELVNDHKVQDLLVSLDISDEDRLDLFETLDVDGNGFIDLEELVIGLRKLRGDARKSDIVGVALIVRSTQLQMNEFMDNVTTSMAQIQSSLSTMRTGAPIPVGTELSSGSFLQDEEGAVKGEAPFYSV